MPYDGNIERRLFQRGPLRPPRWRNILVEGREKKGRRIGLGKYLSKEAVLLIMRNFGFPSQTRSLFVFSPNHFYDTWVFSTKKMPGCPRVGKRSRDEGVLCVCPLRQLLEGPPNSRQQHGYTYCRLDFRFARDTLEGDFFQGRKLFWALRELDKLRRLKFETFSTLMASPPLASFSPPVNREDKVCEMVGMPPPHLTPTCAASSQQGNRL